MADGRDRRRRRDAPRRPRRRAAEGAPRPTPTPKKSDARRRPPAKSPKAAEAAEKPRPRPRSPASRPPAAPTLEPELARLLATRDRVADRRPKFVRRRRTATGGSDAGQSWRRPRGLQSKQRRHYGYRSEVVSIGYGSPRRTRGLTPTGFRPVLVRTPKDLDALDRLSRRRDHRPDRRDPPAARPRGVRPQARHPRAQPDHPRPPRRSETDARPVEPAPPRLPDPEVRRGPGLDRPREPGGARRRRDALRHPQRDQGRRRSGRSAIQRHVARRAPADTPRSAPRAATRGRAPGGAPRSPRVPKKARWMRRIRAQRELLAELRDQKKITPKVYREFYRHAKGGMFRSRAHLLIEPAARRGTLRRKRSHERRPAPPRPVPPTPRGAHRLPARLKLLKSGRPRAVVRFSARPGPRRAHRVRPAGRPGRRGARRAASSTRSASRASLASTPASYLTGYLAGLRAKSAGADEAVLDAGLRRPTQGRPPPRRAQGPARRGHRDPPRGGSVPLRRTA